MSTIDFFEYIKGVLAPQFQNKSAKDYFKTFADVCGVETDRMLQARSDGMINEASADALGYHLTNSSLLVPDFAKEQLIRDLLEDRWDFVAKRVGSSELLLALLAIFGFPKAKIVTWTDLILAGIPSAFGGAPTIAASADPNGTMYYLRVLPTVEVSVYHLNNGPSLPLSVSVGVLAGAATITIQLQTDSLGVVQSTPVQIAKALTAAGADTYVYYSWTGTGLGRAETVSILSLPVVYHSFFYIDLYEPNVITSPILWNDNQITTVTVPAIGTNVSFSRKYEEIPGYTYFSRFGGWPVYVESTSANNVWVWGYIDDGITVECLLSRYNGVTWTNFSTSFVGVQGLLVFADNDVIACGSFGIFHCNGLVVTYLPAIPFSIRNIAGISSSDFIISSASGGGNKVSHFNGVSYTSLPDAPASIHSLVYFGINDLWGLGSGNAYRWDGATWTTYVIPGVDLLYRNWASGPNNIYAGDLNGNLVRWDGTTWTIVAGFAALGFKRITAIDGKSASEIVIWGSLKKPDSGMGAFVTYNGAGVFGQPVEGYRGSSLQSATLVNFSPLDFWSCQARSTPVMAKDQVLVQKYSSYPVGTFNKETELSLKITSIDTHLFGITYFSTDMSGGATRSIYVKQAGVFVPDTSSPLQPMNSVYCYSGKNSNLNEISMCGPNNAFYKGTIGFGYGPFSPPVAMTYVWNSVIQSADQEWFVFGEDGAGNAACWHLDIGAFIPWKNVPVVGATGPIKKAVITNHAPGPASIFACGANAEFFELQNTMMGYVLQKITSPLVTAINDIWSPFASNFVYAVGPASQCYLYWKNVFGFGVWTTISTGIVGDYVAIWGNAANQFWISKQGGVIYFDGNSFTETATAAPTDLMLGGTGYDESNTYAYSNQPINKSSLYKLTPSPGVTYPTGATGKLWNDGWTWDGILPTPNFLSQLKALIRKYKPSTTSCRFIRVQNGMLLSSTPIGEEYEEDSNSNISGPYLFSYTTP